MTKRWSFDSRDAEAAHRTRHQFIDYLRQEATTPSDLFSAELIFGELTGNVARHAPGNVEITLDWRDGQAVLCVADFGKGFPAAVRSLPARMLSETGRGLYIAALIAESLDIEHVTGDGSRIHARLAVYRRDADKTA